MLGHSPANIAFGHYGVNMFFVISGFLITTLLVREKEKYGKISYPKFFMRRLLRIFPLYYLTLAIYCILVLALESDIVRAESFWDNLPYFVTYTSNFFVDLEGRGTIFYFAWSLATEEQFYIFWPLCLVFLSNNRALYLMASIVLLKGISETGLFPPTLTSILYKIPYTICLGSSLAILIAVKKYYERLSFLFNFSQSPIVYLAILSAVFLAGDTILLKTLPVLMTLLVCSVILNSEFFGKSLFTSKFFVSFGKVSYGMYLFHMIVSNVVRKAAILTGLDLGPITYFLATIFITYLVAWVSFNTFEKFFLQLKVKHAV